MHCCTGPTKIDMHALSSSSSKNIIYIYKLERYANRNAQNDSFLPENSYQLPQCIFVIDADQTRDRVGLCSYFSRLMDAIQRASAADTEGGKISGCAACVLQLA